MAAGTQMSITNRFSVSAALSGIRPLFLSRYPTSNKATAIESADSITRSVIYNAVGWCVSSNDPLSLLESSLPVRDQSFLPTGLTGATCQVVVSNRLTDSRSSEVWTSRKLDVQSG